MEVHADVSRMVPKHMLMQLHLGRHPPRALESCTLRLRFLQKRNSYAPVSLVMPAARVTNSWNSLQPSIKRLRRSKPKRLSADAL